MFEALLLQLPAMQRPGLIPYHGMELRLVDGVGTWELRTINK